MTHTHASGWPAWLAAAIIIIETTIVFAPSLRGGLLWHDEAAITGAGPAVVTSPASGWLSRTTWLAEEFLHVQHAVWGDAALGYRLVSLVLHILTALLIWRILRHARVPGAWLIALLFAIDPAQPQAVAWISQQPILLAAFGYTLAVLMFLRWMQGEGAGNYVISLLAFAAALFCHPLALTIPIAIVLVALLARTRRGAAHWLGLAPFVIGAVVMLVWPSSHVPEKTQPASTPSAVAPATPAAPLTVEQRAITAARAYLHYAELAFVPSATSFVHRPLSEAVELDTEQQANLAPVIVVVYAVGAGIVLGIVAYRGVLYATLFFVVVLLPVCGLFARAPVAIGSVGDQLAYLAILGPLALLVGALAAWLNGAGSRLRWANGATFPAAVVAVFAAFGVAGATFARATLYASPQFVWIDAINKAPDNWAARLAYGHVCLTSGAPDALVTARRQFETVQAAEPDNIDAYAGLGEVYARQNRIDDAIAMYRQAAQRAPASIPIYRRLAELLIEHKQYGEAVDVCDQILPIASGDDALKTLCEQARQKAIAQAPPPATQEAGTVAATTQSAAEAPIDLGGATTPDERREAYLRLAQAAIVHRDYARAKFIVENGLSQPDCRRSLDLWQTYCLLIAASPEDELRDDQVALQLAHTLLASDQKRNRRDGETFELLGIASANAGQFDHAIEYAKQAIETFEKPPDKQRVTFEMALYESKQPYRLPARE